ncbi:DUF6279 family lipoprotein [Thermodesulfobacteriota bacterium]
MKNILKGFLFIFILITLSSCGTRFWYNTIDFFILRSLDQYFDITREQKSFLKEKLEYNLSSHREEGIPQHIDFIKGMQTRVLKGIQEEDVKWFYDELSHQIELIRNRLSDVLVDFLMSLKPEQIEHFEEKMADQNEKNKKRRQKNADRNAEDRSGETIKSFEEWLGHLSDTQKKEILNLVRQMPDNREQTNNDQLERQREFIKALRNEPINRDKIEQLLADFISGNPSNDESTALVADFVVKVDRLITQKQRNHFIKKLDVWVDRLEAVAPD